MPNQIYSSYCPDSSFCLYSLAEPGRGLESESLKTSNLSSSVPLAYPLDDHWEVFELGLLHRCWERIWDFPSNAVQGRAQKELTLSRS